ncbi:hypothetical protein F4679DRAFT_454508 [Xylaria curta]|nr:hypothetical protein F4679DRAFT_454508 [Xylaria curta]
MSNARGWTSANSPVGGEDGRMIMIGRDACCQLLRKRVSDDAIVRRKVTDVKLAEGNNKPRLVFQDQTREEFDFVIVCDGIWSRVRRAMFSDQDQHQYDFSPKYEGLIGVGGFIASSKIWLLRLWLHHRRSPRLLQSWQYGDMVVNLYAEQLSG